LHGNEEVVAIQNPPRHNGFDGEGEVMMALLLTLPSHETPSARLLNENLFCPLLERM